MTSQETMSKLKSCKFTVGQQVRVLAKTWGERWARAEFGEDFDATYVQGVIIDLDLHSRPQSAVISFEDDVVETHPLSSLVAVRDERETHTGRETPP